MTELDQSDPDVEAYLVPFVRGHGYVFVEPDRVVHVQFDGRDLLVGVDDQGICGVVEGRAVIEPGDQVEFIERLTRFMNRQTRREPGR